MFYTSFIRSKPLSPCILKFTKQKNCPHFWNSLNFCHIIMKINTFGRAGGTIFRMSITREKTVFVVFHAGCDLFFALTDFHWLLIRKYISSLLTQPRKRYWFFFFQLPENHISQPNFSWIFDACIFFSKEKDHQKMQWRTYFTMWWLNDSWSKS